MQRPNEISDEVIQSTIKALLEVGNTELSDFQNEMVRKILKSQHDNYTFGEISNLLSNCHTSISMMIIAMLSAKMDEKYLALLISNTSFPLLQAMPSPAEEPAINTLTDIFNKNLAKINKTDSHRIIYIFIVFFYATIHFLNRYGDNRWKNICEDLFESHKQVLIRFILDSSLITLKTPNTFEMGFSYSQSLGEAFLTQLYQCALNYSNIPISILVLPYNEEDNPEQLQLKISTDLKMPMTVRYYHDSYFQDQFPLTKTQNALILNGMLLNLASQNRKFTYPELLSHAKTVNINKIFFTPDTFSEEQLRKIIDLFLGSEPDVDYMKMIIGNPTFTFSKGLLLIDEDSYPQRTNAILFQLFAYAIIDYLGIHFPNNPVSERFRELLGLLIFSNNNAIKFAKYIETHPSEIQTILNTIKQLWIKFINEDVEAIQPLLYEFNLKLENMYAQLGFVSLNALMWLSKFPDISLHSNRKDASISTPDEAMLDIITKQLDIRKIKYTRQTGVICIVSFRYLEAKTFDFKNHVELKYSELQYKRKNPNNNSNSDTVYNPIISTNTSSSKLTPKSEPEKSAAEENSNKVVSETSAHHSKKTATKTATKTTDILQTIATRQAAKKQKGKKNKKNTAKPKESETIPDELIVPVKQEAPAIETNKFTTDPNNNNVTVITNNLTLFQATPNLYPYENLPDNLKLLRDDYMLLENLKTELGNPQSLYTDQLVLRYYFMCIAIRLMDAILTSFQESDLPKNSLFFQTKNLRDLLADRMDIFLDCKDEKLPSLLSTNNLNSILSIIMRLYRAFEKLSFFKPMEEICLNENDLLSEFNCNSEKIEVKLPAKKPEDIYTFIKEKIKQDLANFIAKENELNNDSFYSYAIIMQISEIGCWARELRDTYPKFCLDNLSSDLKFCRYLVHANTPFDNSKEYEILPLLKSIDPKECNKMLKNFKLCELLTLCIEIRNTLAHYRKLELSDDVLIRLSHEVASQLMVVCARLEKKKAKRTISNQTSPNYHPYQDSNNNNRSPQLRK